MFVYDFLKGNLPKSFGDIFNRVDEIHEIDLAEIEDGVRSLDGGGMDVSGMDARA